MFLIRQSKPEDVSALLKLAKTVYFINLPPDEKIIAEKIDHSQRCFRKAAAGKKKNDRIVKAGSARQSSKAGVGLAAREADSDMFMFSIIEADSGVVVGTSQVRAHMGGPADPNWRMCVREKHFHASSIGFGTTHTTMQLDGDESGPTEVGGLVLDPGFRGHPLRPGRQIAYVRFHWIGLRRALFAGTVLGEMMGSVNEKGESVFWDAFGRKFFPVSYPEADRFCQVNRAFISELFPKEEIYITLLPLEVQNLVGVVARDTLPARRLLESLGFAYRGFVDPFDGGPHLDAPTDTIPLVSRTEALVLGKATTPDRCNERAVVSTLSSDGEFRAVECAAEFVADGTSVRMTPESMAVLGVDAGAKVGATPLGTFGVLSPARKELPTVEVTAKKPQKPRATRKRVRA